MKKGICCAGNMIVDITYPIETWPKQNELTHITEGIKQSTGGSVCNTISDLARLDPQLPLVASGFAGHDAEGDFVLQEMGKYKNIDLSMVKRNGRTSFTAVMSNNQTKERTFFQHAGANAYYGEDDIDWDKLDEAGVDPYSDVLTLEQFREKFGAAVHPFTGVDYIDFYSGIITDAGAEVEVIFGNRVQTLCDYTDAVITCVGGGSNAIGSFYHFVDDPAVRLIGVEAAGRGIDTLETAATISTGRLGIFHGMKSYFCQDEYGQIAPVYSISAGLDYPGVGPEHAYLHDIGRAEYVAITDEEAVQAFEYLARTEGIIPAIESAHAVAYARKLAPTMGSDQLLVVTISGRGDKDCAAIARYRGEDLHE